MPNVSRPAHACDHSHVTLLISMSHQFPTANYVNTCLPHLQNQVDELKIFSIYKYIFHVSKHICIIGRFSFGLSHI